jgi:hypothetical protein
MGGTNETLIDSLRFHVDNHIVGKKSLPSTVHAHDDSKKLKFELNLVDFKRQVEDALKELDKCDGMVKISGVSDDLCIVSDGKKMNLFLASPISNTTTKSELEKFLQSI